MARRSDYDEDITREFMTSKEAPFLASQWLPEGNSYERKKWEEEELRRQELRYKIEEVEQRTFQSTTNCLRSLADSEQVGIETAKELVRQREQLERTDNRLDEINDTLKDTQRDINGIKSVFSSLRNWWSKPSRGSQNANGSPGEKSSEPVTSTPASTSTTTPVSLRTTTHPSLTLRGLEEKHVRSSTLPENPNPDDFSGRIQQANKRLDNDLDQISEGLGRLRGLAINLGTEVEDQNTFLEQLKPKMEVTGERLSSQTSDMNKLLGKK